MNTSSRTVLLALAYHKVFNFPLTVCEIVKYAPVTPVSHENVLSVIKNNNRIIKSNIWYGLGSYNGTDITIRREHAWNLIAYAQKYFTVLSRYIPSIHFVGVTGSTAALDASSQSDIDILIITKSQTGWFTRLLLLTVLSVLGKRTHSTKNNNSYTFCTNLIIEDGQLAFEKKDLFTAMELAHMKPIINKNCTYQKLLYSNKWVKNYLPNYWKSIEQNWLYYDEKTPVTKPPSLVLVTLNCIAKKVQQVMYRLKHKKELTLSHTWVTDHRQKTLDSYQKTLRDLKIRKKKETT